MGRMDAKSAQPPTDLAVLRLAARQHDVIARAQLVAVGLSDTQVAGRVRRGWLRRVHQGVYAVGRGRLTLHGKWMAAVLAAGEGAVLSHRDAAALWRLLSPASGDIHVTLAARAGRDRRPGIAIHRSSSLRRHHTTTHEAIPVTTPARTLLDLAEVVPRRTLERATDEAERLRVFDLRALHEVMAESNGRAGTGLLTALLHEHQAGSTLTRSELEELFLALCRDGEMPPPRVNAWIALDQGDGYEADFLWEPQRLIAEVDGWESHGTRRAFGHDRRRDRRLRLAGYEPLRFTWHEVTEQRLEVQQELRAHLEAHSS